MHVLPPISSHTSMHVSVHAHMQNDAHHLLLRRLNILLLPMQEEVEHDRPDRQ